MQSSAELWVLSVSISILASAQKLQWQCYCVQAHKMNWKPLGKRLVACEVHEVPQIAPQQLFQSPMRRKTLDPGFLILHTCECVISVPSIECPLCVSLPKFYKILKADPKQEASQIKSTDFTGSLHLHAVNNCWLSPRNSSGWCWLENRWCEPLHCFAQPLCLFCFRSDY